MFARNNIEFSSQDDENLINLVVQYPFLYDLNLPEYKNSFKRDKVWEVIGQELNKTGKDCKNRWKNIKDTYYRQKKKNKSGTGSAAHPKSKFETYRRLLSFLETVSQERTSISNVPEHNDGHSQSSSTQSGVEVSPESSDMVNSSGLSGVVISQQPDPMMTDSENNSINETQLNPQLNPIIRTEEPSTKSSDITLRPPQSIIKKGIKRTRKKQDDILTYLKQRDESRQKLIQDLSSSKNNVYEEDEIDLFTRQANTILKKLPPYYQIKAMQEVFETLTKYKMLGVDSFSGTIHSPSPSSSASESRSGSDAAMYDPLIPTSFSNDSSSINVPTTSDVGLDNVNSPIYYDTTEHQVEPADLSLLGMQDLLFHNKKDST